MLASFLVKSLSLLFRLIFSLFEKAKVKTHCRLHAKYFYISSNVRHFASKYFVSGGEMLHEERFYILNECSINQEDFSSVFLSVI